MSHQPTLSNEQHPPRVNTAAHTHTSGKTALDTWFTKRTGTFAFDVFDGEGLAFHLKSIGWHHLPHDSSELCRMESDGAVIIIYPDNSARVTGENVQLAIDVLEAANGVSHDDQSVDTFARCFAYLRELREHRMSQEMSGSVQ
jgi:hypothetical protein